MTLTMYIRVPGFCALHIECGRELSPEPLLSKSSCGGETLFDMPYCRVIFTPAALLVDRKENAGRTHGRKNRVHPSPSAATAEDRS